LFFKQPRLHTNYHRRGSRSLFRRLRTSIPPAPGPGPSGKAEREEGDDFPQAFSRKNAVSSETAPGGSSATTPSILATLPRRSGLRGPAVKGRAVLKGTPKIRTPPDANCAVRERLALSVRPAMKSNDDEGMRATIETVATRTENAAGSPINCTDRNWDDRLRSFPFQLCKMRDDSRV